MPDLLTAADILPALQPGERAWLSAYREQLVARYPGLLVRLAVFGSKARGDDAGADSDLDVLLLVRGDDDALHRELRDVGHELSNAVSKREGFVCEQIMVYDIAEWEERRREGMPFQSAVEKDAVAVHA